MKRIWRAAALAAACLATGAGADDTASRIRAAVAQCDKSTFTLRAVVSVEMQGQSGEGKVEVSGPTTLAELSPRRKLNDGSLSFLRKSKVATGFSPTIAYPVVELRIFTRTLRHPGCETPLRSQFAWGVSRRGSIRSFTTGHIPYYF